MTKFDLEKALAGEPVVLLNGSKAYVRHHETEWGISYPLIGVYEANSGKAFTASWETSGRYTVDGKAPLDIVGMWHEPLVFEHWDLLLEDIKYLAKDRNGLWWCYPRKPKKVFDTWNSQGYTASISILNPKLFPECDWKESLIARPEK